MTGRAVKKMGMLKIKETEVDKCKDKAT